MKCPLHHEDADYRFGAARTEERIVLRICPRCGIAFVPSIMEEKHKSIAHAKTTPQQKIEMPREKQILKWP